MSAIVMIDWYLVPVHLTYLSLEISLNKYVHIRMILYNQLPVEQVMYTQLNILIDSNKTRHTACVIKITKEVTAGKQAVR